jgi:uncharacterized protein with HEPN domain
MDMIAQFVRDTDLEAFREDPKTIAAVERKDVETVWNTVIDDLPPLRSGVLRALTDPHRRRRLLNVR